MHTTGIESRAVVTSIGDGKPGITGQRMWTSSYKMYKMLGI